VDLEQLGGRLSAARESRRLSQEEVARVLGVTRVLVSYWERGQRRPSEATLERLAGLYGLTLGELLDGRSAAPTADLVELLYRGAGEDIGSEARVGLEDWIRFLDLYADLIEELSEDFVPLRQSPFFIRRGFTSKDDIRRKAEEVRAAYRLGFGPIGELTEVLDEAGITVYRAPLGSELQRSISGAFLNHSRVGICIVVNLETTPGRQAFTIAHELAHALYHSSEDTQVVSAWGRKDERERFADLWAGEFLLPFEGLRRAIESLGIKTVTEPEQAVHLQRYFGVSYALLLLRLTQARLVDEVSYERLKSALPLVIAARLGYRVAAQEWRQDPERWRLERFPRRFVRLLLRGLREGRLSVPSAASLTGLTIDEIADLVAPSNEDFDPAVQQELEQLRDVRERVAI
jgi:Zn-dependent peptidase ImmA (M78 family)/transcriptional regulator with XRE-family HTH domain